ncbi:DUF4054 domain-containing protein [Sphingomonas sp. 1P08PE]|uniref:DUF4054 domain-containing protein n=1 Tax=Sphingomonas sp. 1P08PE TaxID=554122 RepID=UPI0039A2BE2E
MTPDQMRALLGLGPEVDDTAVIVAYNAYLAAQTPAPVATATPADLKARYSAFVAVADNTIGYWLTDALRIVTPAWGEDAIPGQIALAAHNMALDGVTGIAKTAADQLPAGVTRFRSASLDVAVSEAAANRSITGGYSATLYGREFAVMLHRNSGGPLLVGYVEFGRSWF